MWNNRFDDDEFFDPTPEERQDAEEYLNSLGLRPIRVVNANALPEGYHGRWEELSLTDFQMLYQIGISID